MKIRILAIVVLAVTVLAIGIGAIIFASIQTSESKQTIKIGAIQPLSQRAVAVGEQVREGVELAAADINEAGGINGRELQVIYEDDQCDPPKTISSFQKLVQSDKVPVIIGPVCSSVVLAAAPLANEMRVPIITTVASTNQITQSGDYVFRSTPAGRDYSNAIADFAIDKLGAQTASTLYISDPNGADYNSDFVDRFTSRGGRVISQNVYNNEETDFRSYLAKIKSDNSDVLFIAGQLNHGIAMRQARELGVKAQFIGPVVLETPEMITQAGEAAEGVVFSAPQFDPDAHSIKAFRDNYARKYNKTLGFRTVIAYDTVRIVERIMGQCDIDSECIKSGLYAVKDYDGIGGRYSFDANGDVRMPLMIKTVRNEEFVPYYI